MRTIVFYIMITTLNPFSSHLLAQTEEAAQLVINYEKLIQLEEILDNMYRGYKIINNGYNIIRDISEGNFNIHQLFLDGLYAVNPTIRNHQKIPYIIRFQKFIASESKRAFHQFSTDPNLTYREIKYLESMYGYLLKQSLRNMDELLMIITSTRLSMSDDERLIALERIHLDLENKVIYIKMVNSSTQMLSLQRAKENRQINTVRSLYGRP